MKRKLLCTEYKEDERREESLLEGIWAVVWIQIPSGIIEWETIGHGDEGERADNGVIRVLFRKKSDYVQQ